MTTERLSRASWRHRLTAPLTPAQAARIRRHLWLLPIWIWAVFAWSTYAVDMSVHGRLDRSGHIKGHDFLHFYVLGEMGRAGTANELYDFDAHARRVDRILPEYEARFLPVHTPQVAMFFAPLARLPYLEALTVWLVFSGLLYGGSVWLLWRQLPALGITAALAIALAISLPAFRSLVAAGQTSAVALALFVCAFIAFSRGRDGWAGAALGALVYKPTFIVTLPFVLAAGGRRRALAMAALIGLLEWGMAVAYFGPGVVSAYLANAVRATGNRALLESQPQTMHSLSAFWWWIGGDAGWATVAYVVSAGSVIAVALRIWRSSPLPLGFAAMLIGTVLASPHLYAYDLVVLVPALAMVASVMRTGGGPPRIWVAIAACAVLPALERAVELTHIQGSVMVVVWLLFELPGLARREPNGVTLPERESKRRGKIA